MVVMVLAVVVVGVGRFCETIGMNFATMMLMGGRPDQANRRTGTVLTLRTFRSIC